MNQTTGIEPQVTSQSEGRGILIFLCLVVAVWGVAGWMDLSQQSWNGMTLDRDHLVSHIVADSPTERVGMKVNDFVTHIEKISVDDTRNILRLPRTKIGLPRNYYVTRGEVDYEYNIRHMPLTKEMMSLGWVRIIIGFTFLLLPLLAYLTSPNRATKVLVMVGVGLGLSFMGGPYIANYDVRIMFTIVETLFVYTGLAAMLHFLLIFPHERPFMQRSYARKLIYWPAFVLWLLLSWNLISSPAVGSALGIITNLATGLIIGLYLLFGLITLLRSFGRTSKEERKSLGFSRMMIGTIVAVLAVLVASIVNAVSTGTSLPGQQYYFVFVALIPMTWSLAAKNLSRD